MVLELRFTIIYKWFTNCEFEVILLSIGNTTRIFFIKGYYSPYCHTEIVPWFILTTIYRWFTNRVHNVRYPWARNVLTD